MMPIQTGALQSALVGLDVKPELISAIVDKLTEVGDTLGVGFDVAHLGATEFGDRASAATLGLHYGKAYEVMQATIDGIAADLVAFGQRATEAAAYVDAADERTAADLSAARLAIENLQHLSQHSQGDANYDAARNNPSAGTSPETSTNGGA